MAMRSFDHWSAARLCTFVRSLYLDLDKVKAEIKKQLG